MSKILISVAEPVINAEAAAVISRVTGCALNTSKKRLSEGRDGFFYTTELFLNDYPDRADEILELLSEFDRLGIELFILEISHNQNWEDIKDKRDTFRISANDLYSLVENTKDNYS